MLNKLGGPTTQQGIILKMVDGWMDIGYCPYPGTGCWNIRNLLETLKGVVEQH